MAEHSPNSNDPTREIKKILGLYLGKWYFFVISVLLALAIAFTVNRYSVPVYNVKLSLLNKKFDAQRGSALTAIPDGSDLFRVKRDLTQEIAILKSYDIVSDALKKLNFKVSYFEKGRVKTTEIYPYYPFTVSLDSASEKVPWGVAIRCSDQGNGTFTLQTDDEEWNQRFNRTTFQFGEQYDVSGMRFKIEQNNPFNDREVLFRLNRHETLIAEYRRNLNIKPINQQTAIFNISLNSPTPKKEVDFLESYTQVVIRKGLEEKFEYARRTTEFINNQLKILNDSINQYKEQLKEYKLYNRELLRGSSFYLAKLDEIEQKKAELDLINEYYAYLKNYMASGDDEEVFLPNIIEINYPFVVEQLKQYQQLKEEETIVINDENNKNPLLSRGAAKLNEKEEKIQEAINLVIEENKKAMASLDKEAGFILNTARNVLDEESDLEYINRMANFSEQLYSTLLEKRVESNIAQASTTSDYKLIDIPKISGPIKPDTTQNYRNALLIGLLLPIGLIYLINWADERIKSDEDLLAMSNIPFLGTIYHSRGSQDLVEGDRLNSAAAESIRTIRANLQFFLNTNGKKGAKIILVTSAISSEGKTFSAKNLAYFMALSGKKTLIINADLRKKNYYEELQNNADKPGLSNYLAGVVDEIDFIIPSQKENLYLLHSGDIPPNPTELLLNKRLDEFFKRVSPDFDYIVIDTSPIGLFSDTLELCKHANLSLFIVRQNFTKKGAIRLFDRIYNEKKVNNAAFILNDTRPNNRGYGYGYKYGYDNYYNYNRKNWFQRIVSKN